MRTLVLTLIFISLATTFWTCKPRAPQVSTGESKADTLPSNSNCRGLNIRDSQESQHPLVGYTTHLEGDCLKMKISYSGGCEKHSFGLFWDGVWMKSYPPQVNLKLLHNNKGDACEAIVNEMVAFDLTPLRADGVGQVIVNLMAEGLPLQRANYTYP